jgi:hypothetical protein
LEDTDTNAGEGTGRTADFRASAGTSQSLVAYAVAGVALVAVIASGVMFLSYYPTSTPSRLAQPGGLEPEQAPLRLVSPRAMTAEEMHSAEQVPEPGVQTEVAPEAEREGGRATTPAARDLLADAEATTPTMEPGGLEPGGGIEAEPVAAPARREGTMQAGSDSRLVSTTLVAETRAVHAAPVAGLEAARIEQHASLEQPAPGQAGQKERQRGPVDIMAAERARDADPASLEPRSEPVESGPPEAVHRHPETQRLYPPPMVPYGPPHPYLRHNFGPGVGYYRMNTAASDD